MKKVKDLAGILMFEQQKVSNSKRSGFYRKKQGTYSLR